MATRDSEFMRKFAANFVLVVDQSIVFTIGYGACEHSSLLDKHGDVCVWWRRASATGLAFFYWGAGWLHFDPRMDRFFLAITPPWVPWKRAAIAVSGHAEILLSGLWAISQVPPFESWRAVVTERRVAWASIALLIAVFPANLYHAWSRKAQRDTRVSRGATLARLPVQLLFAAWAHWHTCSY